MASIFMPSVTPLRMDSRVTTAAKGNQVFTAVVAALGQRLDVMYLFRFH